MICIKRWLPCRGVPSCNKVCLDWRSTCQNHVQALVKHNFEVKNYVWLLAGKIDCAFQPQLEQKQERVAFVFNLLRSPFINNYFFTFILQ